MSTVMTDPIPVTDPTRPRIPANAIRRIADGQ